MDDIKLYLNKYEKDINKINVIRKLQNNSKLFNIEFTFTNNKIIKFFEDDNIYIYCQIINYYNKFNIILCINSYNKYINEMLINKKYIFIQNILRELNIDSKKYIGLSYISTEINVIGLFKLIDLLIKYYRGEIND